MADGRTNNGGSRPGAGRKAKAEEQDLQRILKAGWPRADRVAAIKKAGERAVKGDLVSLKMLLEYCYGKPKEKHEITGEDGGPINVQHDLDYDALRKLPLDDLAKLHRETLGLSGEDRKR